MVSSPSATSLLPILFALASLHGLIAYDPSPLQDFCIAETKSSVRLNGFPCKNPNKVTVDDFVFTDNILRRRAPTTPLGSNVTGVTVFDLPGLNTQGISSARIDYDPFGINPPHFHPRGSELLTVLEGKLYAGFVTAPPESRLFAKVLNPGDVIIFPFTQIHFQMNIGNTSAAAYSALSSQFPGVTVVAQTTFGSTPPIVSDVLARSFDIPEKEVKRLQRLFSAGSG